MTMGSSRRSAETRASGGAKRRAPNRAAPVQPAAAAQHAAGPEAGQAAIRAAVRAIPAGEVAAYGVVAQRAGLPGRARLVARVLAESAGHDLPWHRVLRADGRIAFPPDSAGFREQRTRLLDEGVDVDAQGRVRAARRAVSLDEALWGSV